MAKTLVITSKETVLRALPVSEPESRHRCTPLYGTVASWTTSLQNQCSHTKPYFPFNIKLENFFLVREEKRKKKKEKMGPQDLIKIVFMNATEQHT